MSADRRRQAPSPPPSPANRQNVILFERDPFVQELTDVLDGANLEDVLEIAHDSFSGTGSEYVMYNVPKPVGDVLHKRMYFQDTNEFDMDWFYESIQYTQTLGPFDIFIIKSYTKYGDEIVNNYLRDPVEFRTNPRVNDLLFSTMPANRHLCFAIQFLNYHFQGNDNIDKIISNFITNNGELIGSEVEDLLDLWDMYRDDYDAIVPIVEEYIAELNRIINAAPRPRRFMRVFRGTKRDYFRDFVNTSVRSLGFISTTMNPDTTFRFGGWRNAFEIILTPSVPCLALVDISYYPREYEILLGNNTVAKPGDKLQKFVLNVSEGDGYYEANGIFDPEAAELPSVYSRLVAVTELPVAGGKTAVKVQNLKRGVTRSKSKQSKRMKMTRRRSMRHRNRRSEYERRPELDMILVKDSSIPTRVDDYLDSVLRQFH